MAELWFKAIESAANFDYSDDFCSESRSLSTSKSTTKSSDTLPKIILPQNFQNSLSSVTLTFFDRNAFFLSISRLAFGIIILLLAFFVGNNFLSQKSIESTPTVNLEDTTKFQKHAQKIQHEYYEFIENNLQLTKNYPEILEQAASEFNMLDGQLTEIVGQVYRIQKEIANH